MGEVVTYKYKLGHLALCQIKLDSGERVLISVAKMGVKIVGQRLGGRLPADTIWSCDDVARLTQLFGDAANPGKHPLESMRDKILGIPSIEALKKFLASE